MNIGTISLCSGQALRTGTLPLAINSTFDRIPSYISDHIPTPKNHT